MNHARLGSLGTNLRLYDNLDHLIRAYECLCREHKLIQQELLPRLNRATQVRVRKIRKAARTALQEIIRDVGRSQNPEEVRVLQTIRSKIENMASSEGKFGLAVVDLLQKFGLPDPDIIDAFIAANPRRDAVPDWASLLSWYRIATIHEGYMNFERKHDASDVVAVSRHLKDAISRILLKECGYVGKYISVLASGYGPQPLDWIQANTGAERLGFDSSDSVSA